MTIDEAIAHAKEVAKEKREELYNGWYFACESRSVKPYKEELEECKKCAEEHEQLVEWLEELKKCREYFDKRHDEIYTKGYNNAIKDFRIAVQERIFEKK